jgi:hypothetical protein
VIGGGEVRLPGAHSRGNGAIMAPSRMRSFAAAVLLVAAIPAQQPMLSATAVGPLTCTVTTPTATSTQSHPAGPMGPIGTVGAGLGASTLNGDLTWQWGNDLSQLVFFARQQSLIAPPAPAGSTFTGDHDIRLGIAGPAGGVVEIEVTLTVTGTPGAPLPGVQVDLGDDGTTEFTQASSAPLRQLFAIGTSPQPIRVRMQTLQSVAGALTVDLWVIVRPAYTDVMPAIGSCVLGSERLSVVPTFEGIAVSSPIASAFQPVALVFGLGLQPIVVPSTVGIPCVLLPSVDFVTLVFDQPYSLPIPAAARPALVWTQGVEFAAGTLATTDGYRIFAQ